MGAWMHASSCDHCAELGHSAAPALQESVGPVLLRSSAAAAVGNRAPPFGQRACTAPALQGRGVQRGAPRAGTLLASMHTSYTYTQVNYNLDLGAGAHASRWRNVVALPVELECLRSIG